MCLLMVIVNGWLKGKGGQRLSDATLQIRHDGREAGQIWNDGEGKCGMAESHSTRKSGTTEYNRFKK